jgi:hypothetical protein
MLLLFWIEYTISDLFGKAVLIAIFFGAGLTLFARNLR